MKNTLLIKRILCIVLAIVLLCSAIGALERLLGHKSSYMQFDMFYDAQTDFDVLFMGSSHMQNALSPMQLYEQQGIASYNMGIASCRMAYCYWLTRNALLCTKPELIVIDCGYLNTDEKHAESGAPNHRLFNRMPMSTEKLRAIFDLYDTRAERMRYLFPLTEFHRRWNELEQEDFAPPRRLMGFEPIYTVAQARLYSAARDDSALEDNWSTRYLARLIELCQAQDIEVLLVCIPYEANADSRRAMSYSYAIAEKYGVNYIDPDTFAAFLNTGADFCNSYEDNSHLNMAGAVKTTEFLGRYIRENYELPDRRQDANFALWNDYYEDYLEILDEGMAAMENPAELFSLLYAGRHSAFISLNSPELCSDSTLSAAMENLGIEPERLMAEGCLLLHEGGLLYGEQALASPLYAAFAPYLSDEDCAISCTLMRDGEYVDSKTF